MIQTMTASTPTTTLDIVSDPVCPWCYIGKAHLDRALAAAGGHPLVLRWRPFQLNPDLPAGGVDRQRYLEAKFGGPEIVRRLTEQVTAAAAAVGLELRHDRVARIPNTFDAHRLLRWAAIEGCQTATKAELFRRHFHDGEDISDPDVLAATAEAVGMEGTLVRRLLATDADRDTVREEDAAARAIGVTGVPTFILGGRYVLTGVQPSELWTRVIAELAEFAAAAARAEPQPVTGG